MFCSKCGSELASGAKFCSECGTKVEKTQARELGALAFDEVVSAPEAVTPETVKAEEAFKERVSFDWSNVIDEPQKKEVPQGIKSPWAATTESITERELYSEMTESDDKNRTLNFIDVLKADKEERERAAQGSSIEYTEVLELDPEAIGGTKPPKLRFAALYEDVDEPVKTPFDDIAEESDASEESIETPAVDIPKEEPKAEETSEPRKETPKFEMPDFLKKAAGFEDTKNVEPEISIENVVEEPVFEAAAEILDEKSAIEPAEETSVADVADTLPATSAAEEMTEDFYLDEDLYLDLEETSHGAERMSRVDANTIAGVYDEIDLEDNDILEESSENQSVGSEMPNEQPLDENALFAEMSETPAGHTGMTIAAPADEEEEIEALKKRLAELTGTVDMGSELFGENSETDEPEVETPALDTLMEPEEKVESEESINDSFESLGSDFTFEPEVTAAEDELFAGLTPASDPAVSTPAVEEPAFESLAEATASQPETEEPVLEDATESIIAGYVSEDAVDMATATNDAAEEPKTAEPSFGLTNDDEVLLDSMKAETAPPTPRATVSPIVGFAPAITESEEFVKSVAIEPEAKNETEATTEPATEIGVETEFAAKFGIATEAETEIETASAPVTATVENSKMPVAESATEAAEPPKMPETPTLTAEDIDIETTLIKETVAEPPKEIQPETVPVVKDVAPVENIAAKASDAVSLQELERELFGELSDDSAHEPTKKIDKFYTLYKKNEEFQRLLDEEYNRLKGEHLELSEYEQDEESTESTEASLEGFSVGGVNKEAESANNEANEATTAILEELAGSGRPIEDATIYRVGMPEETSETAKDGSTNIGAGFSVDMGNSTSETKSLGLDGTETAVVAAAAVTAKNTAEETNAASSADASANASTDSTALNDKAARKAAKKAEREAKKAAKKPQKAEEDSHVEYEDVDGGSVVLTILAVLIAILLVVLLVIIMLFHFAPDSGIVMTIEQFIENITSKFTTSNALDVYKLL